MSSIAIIGAGGVGRALGAGMRRVGHDVTFGVRSPDDARHADLHARAMPREAAAGAEAVVLAVPAPAVADTIAALGLAAGTTLVDATNAVGAPVPDGHPTMGALTASHAPAGVAVVKAFNTIGAEHLDGGAIDGRAAFLPIGGDAPGVDLVHSIAASMGFDAVVLGGRETFTLIEAHAALWIHLAFGGGWGRSFGFTVVGR